MNVLKIKLKQSQANYRKPECIDNKMTFPLPPISTMLGALHKACGYTEYHNMDLSIQGTYGSMEPKLYKDHCFLNSTQDDRGILIKHTNNNLMGHGYVRVAEALKKQGNSFKKGVSIQVLNEQLLQEFRDIQKEKEKYNSDNKEIYKPKIKEYKDTIKQLKDSIKKDKGTSIEDELKEKLIQVEKERKEYEAQIKAIKTNLDEAYSKFGTLTTSVKHYEVLYDIELIIHIRADENTLNEIEHNIYNLTSLGRSEDFVEIVDCKKVEVLEDYSEAICKNSAYVNFDSIEDIDMKSTAGYFDNGTVYYLNEKYEIINNQRIFNKVKALHTSNFEIFKNDSKFIYLDEDKDVIVFLTDKCI